MATYEIRYANDAVPDTFDSEDDARNCLTGSWPDGVFADEWEPIGYSNGRARLLFWTSEEEAQNDDGARAHAQIIRVGEE